MHSSRVQQWSPASYPFPSRSKCSSIQSAFHLKIADKITDTLSNTLIEKENTSISSKIETKKPLEQVNISDLLALHKKS